MRENFGDAVGDTLRSILLFLPKAVAFVAILVAGWLVAKAVLKLVDRLLERVGFDRAVERGGIRRALARSPYDASDIVARLAYYGVLLLTLYLAFGIWGPNPISDLIAGVIAWLPRAFVAIVIVVVAAAIASAVKDIISGALGGLSYGRLLATIASAFIIGLGIIAALNQVGVATAVTTPVLVAVLATIGGILVVGVGGGLIRPMQKRWESWLSRAELESRSIAEHARAYTAARRDAAPRTAEPATPDASPTAGAPAAAASAFSAPGADPLTSTGGVSTPGSAGISAYDDPDATQIVPMAATDSDSTSVLPRQQPDRLSQQGDPTAPLSRSDDPDATGVIPPLGDDPDATGVIRSAADDPDATGVIRSGSDDPDATGVIRSASDDPDATGVVAPATDVPAQRSADDSESTMILPRPDERR